VFSICCAYPVVSLLFLIDHMCSLYLSRNVLAVWSIIFVAVSTFQFAYICIKVFILFCGIVSKCFLRVFAVLNAIFTSVFFNNFAHFLCYLPHLCYCFLNCLLVLCVCVCC
jgi:hypothetical protein